MRLVDACVLDLGMLWCGVFVVEEMGANGYLGV
jgi:hypothetical protein